MAIKGIFVGVNKHLDAAIPELSGARRDATALWAVFTDTVEGLTASLLVDDAATHVEVSAAMLGTLADASADDVVIIAFAGHGSPDGNLVLFDTSASDLAGTALPMAGLADAFKATKARTVLCILDCCFSGQAPARLWHLHLVAGANPFPAERIAQAEGVLFERGFVDLSRPAFRALSASSSTTGNQAVTQA